MPKQHGIIGQKRGAEMKTEIAACIFCIALTQQCVADETLFTCKEANQRGYVADGGQDKPGWFEKASPNLTKLIKTAEPTKTGSFYDIQTTTQYGTVSFLKDSCEIKEILDSSILDLDQAFVVTCKTYISTYLFYTRSGVTHLLAAHLSFAHASTGTSVTAAKDCNKGD